MVSICLSESGFVPAVWFPARSRRLSVALAAAWLSFLPASILAGEASARTIELNTDWRFNRGDQTGAEQSAFDDHDWRLVAVPHDWSIEDLSGQAHPFDRNAPGGASIATFGLVMIRGGVFPSAGTSRRDSMPRSPGFTLGSLLK